MGKLCFLAAVLLACSARGTEVSSSVNGSFKIFDAKIDFNPVAFTTNWAGLNATGAHLPDDDGVYRFTLEDKKKALKLPASMRYEVLKSGNLAVDFITSLQEDTHLAGIALTTTFHMDDYGGGVLGNEEYQVAIPSADTKKIGFEIYNKSVTNFFLKNARGQIAFTMKFEKPTQIRVQENRRYGGDTLTLRIGANGDNKKSLFRKGNYSVKFELSAPDGIKFTNGGVVLKPGKDWVPLQVMDDMVDGSALDFSKLRGTGAPAGKYGRVVCNGQNFEFEKLPGVPQRFYGINICSSATTLDYEVSKKFARKLAKVGYNSVRIHHHEKCLVKEDGTTLDPEAMKKFDGFVSACIDNGLYLTTDLFVSRRPIKYRSLGIDLDGDVEMNEYKALVQVHEGAFQNFLKYSRQFLNHVNAYTGRRLADEPALGWLSFVNEGNMGCAGLTHVKKHKCWKDAWVKWLREKKAVDSAYANITEDFPKTVYLMAYKDPQYCAYIQFLVDMEKRFAKRVSDFLRNEIGCKALTTNMNNGPYPEAYQTVRADGYDYVDCHFYEDHPNCFIKHASLPSVSPNRNPFKNKEMGSEMLCVERILNRPFTVTEFNYSCPSRFRTVGGLAFGAMGALQNWAGLWRFTWSDGKWGVISKARMGHFNVVGDPAMLASERAAVCLFVRRDLEEHKNTYALKFSPKKLSELGKTSPKLKSPLIWFSWFAKLGGIVTDENIDLPLLTDDVKNDKELIESGPVKVDSEKGSFFVSSPRTCGGFAESGVVKTELLTADVGDVGATVWVSSLDGKPIVDSRRMLFTHLTDVQNSNIKYADGTRTVVIDWGKRPHIMQVGCAKVSIKVMLGDWKIYALAADGTRRYEVPFTYDGGVLNFTVRTDTDKKDASFLYELVR